MPPPRDLCPSDEELIELGEELLQWLDENPDAILLSQWYARKKRIIFKKWRKMIEQPVFRTYYEAAAAEIHSRHMQGAIKEGLAHRYCWSTSEELRQSETEQMQLKVRAKLEAQKESFECLSKIMLEEADNIKQRRAEIAKALAADAVADARRELEDDSE